MEIYKSRLLNKLRYFKIPESAYSFEGEKQGDCVFLEKIDNTLYVYETKNNNKSMRGEFFNETAAYDFVFYLVMKKYVSIKKRWW